MRTVLALAALLLVAACGSDDGVAATDPSGARPTAVPAAPGSVTTRGIVTVMDTGNPELCLGPIAESYPPQCSGPPIDGWDWGQHRGMYESEQGVRWGEFVVTGSWDGTTLGYESAVGAAVYDPTTGEEPTYEAPSVQRSAAELEDIAEQVGDELPGAQGASAHRGRVLVAVIYDDGSLQDLVDREYGEGVVVVTPLLLDVAE